MTTLFDPDRLGPLPCPVDGCAAVRDPDHDRHIEHCWIDRQLRDRDIGAPVPRRPADCLNSAERAPIPY